MAWLLPVDGCPANAVKKIGTVSEVMVMMLDFSIKSASVLHIDGIVYSNVLLDRFLLTDTTHYFIYIIYKYLEINYTYDAKFRMLRVESVKASEHLRTYVSSMMRWITGYGTDMSPFVILEDSDKYF